MVVKSLFEELLFSTVQIQTSVSGGVSSGTGFIFNYEYNSKSYPFLISNKHVVAGAIDGHILFHLAQGTEVDLEHTYTHPIKNFSNQWFFHPDSEVDVAIMPIGSIIQQLSANNTEIFYRAVSNDIVPSSDTLDEIEAIEDVIIIGYPNGLYDTKHYLPIVRKGITATPVNIDFDERPQFIIDASIFPGSSGSPVFICNVGSFTKKGSNTLFAGKRVIFLGLVASVYTRSEFNKLELITIPTQGVPMVKSSQMLDLGVVFKASCVVNAIELFLKQTGVF